jgi:hypothetical protein
MDINASLEIWNFVSKYDINGLIGCRPISIAQEIQIPEVLSVYPNPTNALLTIELNKQVNEEFQIYSAYGELKLKGVLQTNKETIDLSSFPPGVFILKINSSTQRILKI